MDVMYKTAHLISWQFSSILRVKVPSSFVCTLHDMISRKWFPHTPLMVWKIPTKCKNAAPAPHSPDSPLTSLCPSVVRDTSERCNQRIPFLSFPLQVCSGRGPVNDRRNVLPSGYQPIQPLYAPHNNETDNPAERGERRNAFSLWKSIN